MTSSVYSRGIVFAIAFLTMASAAQAGTIAIFNTGVAANGTPLPDGTLGDSHYALISVPGGTTDLRVRTAVGGFPISPWVGDTGLSAWIGPNNPNDDPTSPTVEVDGPIGMYVYRTTFDLTGFVPGTASLLGQWSMDDLGVNIRINGVSTGNTAPDPGFMTFSTFSINSGFIAGVNTLDFIVNNDGGPTGLRVEVAGTATAQAPEPGSLLLLGAGFAGLCMLRRRLGWAGKLQ